MLNKSIGQQPNACDIVLRLLLHKEHVKVPSVCSSGAGVSSHLQHSFAG